MSLKKAFKKAVKQVVGGVKTFASDPLSKEGLEAGAGVALSPATGGASLSATADAGRRTENLAALEEAQQRADAELVAENQKMYGFSNLSDVLKAKRKKEEDLAGRESVKATGISSLIGKGKTLG